MSKSQRRVWKRNQDLSGDGGGGAGDGGEI